MPYRELYIDYVAPDEVDPLARTLSAQIRDEPGAVLAGRYRLIEPIGGGVGGMVWRCHDDELDADRLERELTALLADPAHLAAMASAMRQGASVDAAERVAAVVEQAARG